MIHVVAYDRRAAERDAIRSSLWKKIERLPEEDMEFREAQNSSELLTALEERNDPDLLYYEFLKGQTVTELRSLRKRCENALLMLIADAAVSPLEYLKPGIAPDSLLLRPYTKEMLSEINGEFVQTHLDRAEEDDGEKFMVETKSGKVFISYSKIFYFEARDKKLFVRTADEEYPFYGTIDALGAALPAGFRRCHRSYIINVGKISRVAYADNEIEMGDGIFVPVSRRYKKEFREIG